jgi:predicted transcriptional regulator
MSGAKGVAHVPTDEMRETVSLHATVGTPQAVIADILGIDDKTLRKHYRAELDLAGAKATAVVGGELYKKAKSGDTAAMIFWMKTRAGWSETNRLEHSSPDGSMTPTVIRIMGPDDAA